MDNKCDSKSRSLFPAAIREIFDLMIENLTTDICVFNSANSISILRAIHIFQQKL